MRIKEKFKISKIGQFFALKKFKYPFLKSFPRFDLTAFFCDFPHVRKFMIQDRCVSVSKRTHSIHDMTWQ